MLFRSGVTGPTTIPPTSPTTPPTTIPPSVSPPPTPPPTPVGGTTTVIDGHTVTLIDIFHRNGVKYAQVSVDGTVYTVKQGQTFDGNFKLVVRHENADALELYDLSTDPSELNNLASAQPARLATMVAAWNAWATRVGVPAARQLTPP